MSELTVQSSSTSGGFNFLRSDGERFFLVYRNDGSATLYKGGDRNDPPELGIVEFDFSVTDKLVIARRWVLSFPTSPEEV